MRDPEYQKYRGGAVRGDMMYQVIDQAMDMNPTAGLRVALDLRDQGCQGIMNQEAEIHPILGLRGEAPQEITNQKAEIHPILDSRFQGRQEIQRSQEAEIHPTQGLSVLEIPEIVIRKDVGTTLILDLVRLEKEKIL